MRRCDQVVLHPEHRRELAEQHGIERDPAPTPPILGERRARLDHRRQPTGQSRHLEQRVDRGRGGGAQRIIDLVDAEPGPRQPRDIRQQRVELVGRQDAGKRGVGKRPGAAGELQIVARGQTRMPQQDRMTVERGQILERQRHRRLAPPERGSQRREHRLRHPDTRRDEACQRLVDGAGIADRPRRDRILVKRVERRRRVIGRAAACIEQDVERYRRHAAVACAIGFHRPEQHQDRRQIEARAHAEPYRAGKRRK